MILTSNETAKITSADNRHEFVLLGHLVSKKRGFLGKQAAILKKFHLHLVPIYRFAKIPQFFARMKRVLPVHGRS